MEPTEALRSVETRLRLILKERLGDGWVDQLPEGQRNRLKSWRANDVVKRGAHVAHDDLANYTMTGELARLVTDNWDTFEPVFGDRSEFEWLVRTVETVRNTIAHSRTLLPHERDLLSGAAGKINQLVAAYRANAGTSDAYFPRIERLTDSLGTNWLRMNAYPPPHGGRLDVGTVLSVQCSSTPVRGKALRWELRGRAGADGTLLPDGGPLVTIEGNTAEFRYEVREEDIHEMFVLFITLHTDSAHARHNNYGRKYDEMRSLRYSVNPND